MGDPISIGVGILTGGSLFEGRKARKDTKKARAIDERRGRLQTQRQSVEQIRKAQQARAQVVAQGEAQGVGESSGVLGGLGAIQSQAGGNIGFAQQIFGLQQSASRLRSSAQGHMGNSQAFGQLAGLAANFSGPGLGADGFSKTTQRADGGAPVIDITKG